jgi:hypothetical protein
MEITHTLKKTENHTDHHRRIGNIETKINGHKRATKKKLYRTKKKKPTEIKLTNTKKETSNLQIEDSHSTMAEDMNSTEELRDIPKIEMINHT